MADNWGNVGEQIGGIVKYAKGRCAENVPCDSNHAWADADCLEIGNNLTKITYVQAQSYFSWYAVANAPLIMSTRIDTMDPTIKTILTNQRVIAIQNDYAGRVGVPVGSPLAKGEGTVWAKPLSNQATNPPPGYASAGVAAFLLGGTDPTNVTVYFNDLGIGGLHTKAMVRDVVSGKDVGVFEGAYTATLSGGSSSTLITVVAENSSPAPLH